METKRLKITITATFHDLEEAGDIIRGIQSGEWEKDLTKDGEYTDVVTAVEEVSNESLSE